MRLYYVLAFVYIITLHNLIFIAPRIVTVARSAEKLSSMKQKFGNLSEDKLLIVEGNVGKRSYNTQL